MNAVGIALSLIILSVGIALLGVVLVALAVAALEWLTGLRGDDE